MVPTAEPFIVYPPNDHSDVGKNVFSYTTRSKELYLGHYKADQNALSTPKVCGLMSSSPRDFIPKPNGQSKVRLSIVVHTQGDTGDIDWLLQREAGVGYQISGLSIVPPPSRQKFTSKRWPS
jgi:hypothetical protein